MSAVQIVPPEICLPVTSTQQNQDLPAAVTSQDTVSQAKAKMSEALELRKNQRAESSQRAQEIYEEAAGLWESLGNHAEVAVALRNAGELSHGLSDTKSALSLYRQALAASRRAQSRLQEGMILNDMGYVYFLTGEVNLAIENCSKAHDLARDLGDQTLEVHCLINLGYCYYTSGDLQRATQYQDKALELVKNLNDEAAHSKALVAQGYNFMMLGEPAKARDCESQAVSLARKTGDLRAESLALIGQAILEAKLGEKQEARNLYQAAQKLVEQIGDRSLEASVLGGLGYVSTSLGEKERALDYSKQAMSLFEATDDKWGLAEASLDVGRTYHSLGDHQRALEYFRRALSLFKILGMPRLVAQTLRDLGLAYASLGDLTQAISTYEGVLKRAREGQDQREEAYTLNYIGRAYADLKQEEKALDFYDKALELNRIADDPAGQSYTLYNIARAQLTLGNLKAARSGLEKAVELVESLRTKVASQDSRAAYFASTHQYYELYVDVLMQSHQRDPLGGFDKIAFQASEKARARSLLESLREASGEIQEGVDPGLLARKRLLEEELNLKAARHSQLLANKSTNAEEIAKDIDRLTAEYADIKGQIRARSPRYAALTEPQPLSLTELQQQLLDDNTLLLEYMLGDDRSYVWLVSHQEVWSFQLPARSKIEAASGAVYSLLSQNEQATEIGKDPAKLATAISNLSESLLAPLADRLGSKRLLIVPDGVLQYVPFGTLTVARQTVPYGRLLSRPLVLDHEIINEPSASALALVLSQTANRRPTEKSVAIFADPVFAVDDTRIKYRESNSSRVAMGPVPNVEMTRALRDVGLENAQIYRLPSSRDEANAIIASAPWHTAFKAVDFDATRATAMALDLGQYRIVHFATHALLDNEHPELSGIVLSLVDEKGQQQDGFLRLHDIYNLKLPVELVVLSACQTGLGKDVKGEGLIGLTRGFMYAGASGIVASLWKVDDDATAELMKHFYDGLFNRGLTPAAALREAQLTLRQDKRWREPYYWAGFVIQGEYNQTVSGGYHRSMLKVVIIGSLLAIFLTILICAFLRRRRRSVSSYAIQSR